MKKTVKRWGSVLMIALVSVGLMTLSSCTKEDDPSTPGGGGGGSTSTDQWAYLVNETSHDVQVNGNTLTYGDHVYTVNGEIDYNSTIFNQATAFVTFTNVPSGYTEFEAVYKNLLGKSIQGTAAMIPMAFEIYARNAATGEKCLNLLCNSSVTVTNIVRELKQKLVPSQYAPQNDQYIQRYLPAATLKGASNTNGYKPDEPYTIEMCASVNGIVDAPLTGGTDYYIYVLAPGGWDTFQRGVEVFQPYGETEYYKLFNCPATYSQCKVFSGTWQGLK